ncbi:PEP-CTERM-box response regulator transcription factor [Paracraurococcus ruber]|uniref:PEP-CTERM-box response regulator transcription factor n=1 Tax=Paracraurococcus ruber TaxID=77675 RepID=A0ABS1CW66_9PROT|nr:PEP-CTERM-box response regulator transcription factor [Paracraurococcus ruber]MBK1658282.1 PEP-CTERM-box response regulator transcription factor [Paracraurococcus ruber]TDG31013.1 PEP-CTERM-box response regulator transcription factor [Paracraurococcus ruber]
MTKPKLLVVEDDPGLCAQYRWAFPACRVLIANDRRAAEAAARRDQPDAVLLDLGLPPDAEGVSEGFATLELLRGLSPTLPVVVASGQGQRENALRAIALGAYDFCEKPVDVAVLRTVVERALRLRELEEENQRLAAAPRNSAIQGIITADDGMLKICRTVERLAGVSVPVLLLGESGTGKEALARALHELGPRAAKPFIALNCAAIPENLLESELFGHEKGAFTGAVRQVQGKIELASGGTLFLDEIGEMPVLLQAKLLRFLQDQVVERIGGRSPIKVDVRVVSATNQPLEEQAETGRFRGDLLYRLNAMTVRIPPLRDRGGDAVLLARYFLARFAREHGRRLRGFDAAAAEAIAAHRWPGNVRELENRVRRAVLMTEGPLVGIEDLEIAPAPATVAEDADLDLRAARTRAEREAIERALGRSGGSLAGAARLLGISRPTLYSLLETHGLAAARQKPDGSLAIAEPDTV